MRLGWLSGIGAVDLDACVGVVSALRSRAGPRGSQGLCPPPGAVGCRVGSGEGGLAEGLWCRVVAQMIGGLGRVSVL